MSIKALNPYLMFDGTAEKAIQLYERALGAKAETVQRFGDIPGMPAPPEHKNRVMHAMLKLDQGVIMISDEQPGNTTRVGNNVHVCLEFDDVADMTKKFEALADGGKVVSPLQDTFWGAKFGLLTDAYGVNWMFNCTLKK
jgi:PhnB protein